MGIEYVAAPDGLIASDPSVVPATVLSAGGAIETFFKLVKTAVWLVCRPSESVAVRAMTYVPDVAKLYGTDCEKVLCPVDQVPTVVPLTDSDAELRLFCASCAEIEMVVGKPAIPLSPLEPSAGPLMDAVGAPLVTAVTVAMYWTEGMFTRRATTAYWDWLTCPTFSIS